MPDSLNFEMHCNECDLPATTAVTVCSRCGGVLNKRYDASLNEKLTTRESVSMKHRRPGVKKPLIESVQGDSYHHDTGEWVKVEQFTDRTVRPPRYLKKVVGTDGTVYKDVDMPLADQSAHGPQERVRHEWRPDPPDDKLP